MTMSKLPKRPTTLSPTPKNTRLAILDILKREGPQSAGALARRLGITPMAIGLQLATLELEKVVFPDSDPISTPHRGRPVRQWRLTETANRVFPDAHAILTVGLLNSLQEVYGHSGIEKILESRARQYVDENVQHISNTSGLKEKVKALANLRDREGYMAEVRPQPGGGFLLIENHCPICTAAKTCQAICQSEIQTFQSLLGNDVKVTREEHIVTGDRRCVYAIRPSIVKKKKGPGQESALFLH